MQVAKKEERMGLNGPSDTIFNHTDVLFTTDLVYYVISVHSKENFVVQVKVVTFDVLSFLCLFVCSVLSVPILVLLKLSHSLLGDDFSVSPEILQQILFLPKQLSDLFDFLLKDHILKNQSVCALHVSVVSSQCRELLHLLSENILIYLDANISASPDCFIAEGNITHKKQIFMILLNSV